MLCKIALYCTLRTTYHSISPIPVDSFKHFKVRLYGVNMLFGCIRIHCKIILQYVCILACHSRFISDLLLVRLGIVIEGIANSAYYQCYSHHHHYYNTIVLMHIGRFGMDIGLSSHFLPRQMVTLRTFCLIREIHLATFRACHYMVCNRSPATGTYWSLITNLVIALRTFYYCHYTILIFDLSRYSLLYELYTTSVLLQ